MQAFDQFSMIVVRLMVVQAEAGSIYPLGMMAHSARGDVYLPLYFYSTVRNAYNTVCCRPTEREGGFEDALLVHKIPSKQEGKTRGRSTQLLEPFQQGFNTRPYSRIEIHGRSPIIFANVRVDYNGH